MTNQDVLSNLGVRIKELRLKKKITQNELAMLCNFEKASMSRIESGKTNITITTLHKIGSALNVELGEFFPDGNGKA